MQIELLSKLARLVRTHKPSQINILNPKENDQCNVMYNLLVNKDFGDNDDIAKLMYNQTANSAFYKVKKRLEVKLFNTLYFIDLKGPKYSTRLKSATRCYKNMALYFLLTRFSQNYLKIYVGEKLYKEAKKMNLPEITVPIAMDLKNYFSVTSLNFSKYKFYSKEAENQLQLLNDQYYVDDVFTYLFSRYAQSRSSHKQQIYEYMSLKIETLDTIKKRSSSYTIVRSYFTIRILYAQIINDIDLGLKYCNDGIQELSEMSMDQNNVAIINILIQKLNLHILQKNYFEGIMAFKDADQGAIEYSHNWHALRYLKFLLCMQCQKYVEGYNVYIEANFDSSIPAIFAEMWSIFEAYVFISINHINYRKEISFSANKYVNNIPTYYKDKRGNNVSILIAHFILLCIQKKYNQAIDREESLKQYTRRYLMDDETKRSNCFIRMLSAVVKGNFHPVAAERHAAKYKKILSETPSTISEQSSEIEIIPYEELWKILLKVLEKNRRA